VLAGWKVVASIGLLGRAAEGCRGTGLLLDRALVFSVISDRAMRNRDGRDNANMIELGFPQTDSWLFDRVPLRGIVQFWSF
jgi:hypothetical protein